MLLVGYLLKWPEPNQAWLVDYPPEVSPGVDMVALSKTQQFQDWFFGRLPLESRDEVVFVRRLANGLEVQMQRTGLVFFQDNDAVYSEDVLLEMVRVVNAHLLIMLALSVGDLPAPVLKHFTALDVIRGTAVNTQFRPVDQYPHPQNQFDNLVRYRVIPAALLEESCQRLDGILSRPDAGRILDYIDLVMEATYGFVEKNYVLAVVAGWTVCEALLLDLWEKYPALPPEPLRAARRTKRLAAAGKILPGAHNALDAARDARNDWLHAVKRPSVDTARDAAQLSWNFMSWTLDLGLPNLNLGPPLEPPATDGETG